MDPVLFRGLGDNDALGAPLILARKEDDFVAGLLAQLKSEQPIEHVRATVATARDRNGVLRLLQPVHRTFHVVAMEVACGIPGEPRLEGAKIESAGMVVRRVSRVVDERRKTRARYAYSQAWLKTGAQVRGWVSLGSDDDAAQDPDPKRRPMPHAGPAAANDRLRTLLQGGTELATESSAPMFVAPPDVCASAKRTVIFGMIPTASVEAVDPPPAGSGPAFDDADLQAMIPAYLRSAPPSLGPVAGLRFTYAEAAAREQLETRGARSNWWLKNFLTMLRALVTQFRAFEDTPDGRGLVAELNRVSLPFAIEPKQRPAGDYLALAARLLVLEPDPDRTTRVDLPTSWPAFPADVVRRVSDRLGTLAERAYADVAPRTTRFEDLSAHYQVTAYVRIKRDDGCPPLLVWSKPSEPFSIAPWYENGGPPVSVQMPDLTRDNIKQLRPNVSLKLPRRLFNFLNENDPKDLMDGKGKEGTTIGLDWICGFNIPIITIVAFIVLFIFLNLLNIIFWWLPFIKICFPIPSIKKENA